jgi:hypothetical protein
MVPFRARRTRYIPYTLCDLFAARMLVKPDAAA